MGTINIQSTDLSHKAGLTYTGTSDKTIDVDSLVSGTNIKTINSTSLLGSGDISITETAWVSNDSRAKTALNATGSAPIYACRAWVNFNGTGTVAIRASGNVSSITDNGTGLYTVNFTTAMPDANYTLSGSAGSGSVSYLVGGFRENPLTTSHKILIYSDTGTATDTVYATALFHR